MKHLGNDWWQIIRFNDEKVSYSQELQRHTTTVKRTNKLEHNCLVAIIHVATDNYLTASSNIDVVCSEGLEVSCISGTPREDEWKLIGIIPTMIIRV
jgi:hypothetical protein